MENGFELIKKGQNKWRLIYEIIFQNIMNYSFI